MPYLRDRTLEELSNARGRMLRTMPVSEPNALGYAPRPDRRTWHGTPIPPVLDPLPGTPELTRIAKTMWWNGEPWTILRNRVAFLRHATDHATEDECEYLWRTIPRSDWVKMLRTAEPGQMSMRSYKYWMWRAELLGPKLAIGREWHRPRHIRDLVHLRRRPISARRKLLEQEEAAHEP